jgi:hypothetical protein
VTTPGLPAFPTRRSLDAKVRRYTLAAHDRGDHQTPKPTCPACQKESR